MRLTLLASAAVFVIASSTAAQNPATDPISGLKMNNGWELVRDNCTACHSARLITQQRGGIDYWLGLIRWMEATQGLRRLPVETEENLIAYLATNYPARTSRRRAPLARELMPPHPRLEK